MRVMDETFDHWICRPMGRRLAQTLVGTRITADQVTGVAALFGTLAGVGFAFPWPGPAIGAGSLFLMMVLDCTDGEIARMRGGGSWRGRVLDGMADLATAFSVHLGMLLYLVRQQPLVRGYELNAWVLFFVALFAGASMAWNSAVVDGAKQRLRDRTVDRELGRYSHEPKTLWDRFLYWFLLHYVDRIDRAAAPCHGSYTSYRVLQWTGPTHHHLGMVIAGLAVGAFPLAPLWYFLISLGPANLLVAGALALARMWTSSDDGATIARNKH